ncbi:hypothetical protein [Streptomyces sp. NBC_01768]|uniref:hypothetical protein n=1 Tax=Streptomyces sp. NBC_01768 TaxID=2975938 RepID=UPI002DD9114B|nr:hypothetical protein [Streptomyces sp. NBC_01768]WSC31834.1 hypothetical protein OG902_36880 [Streptomyces sp. NBC_01768]
MKLRPESETVRRLIVPTCVGAFVVPYVALRFVTSVEVSVSVGFGVWLVAVVVFAREGCKRFKA